MNSTGWRFWRLFPKEMDWQDGFVRVNGGGVALFGVSLIGSLSYTLGLGKRWIWLTGWATTTLIYDANPLVVNAGNHLALQLMFLSFFLPITQRFSLGREPSFARPVFQLATVVCFFVMLSLYWIAAVSKYHPIWQHDGLGVIAALKVESYATSLAPVLLKAPEGLLSAMSHSVLILEEMAPLCLLIPFWNWRVRCAAVLTMVGFHMLGIFLFFRIGCFPFVCAAAWVLFLPPNFWQAVGVKDEGIDFAETGLSNWGRTQIGGLGVLLVVIVLSSFSQFSPTKGALVFPFDRLEKVLSFQQNWKLFAPRPRSTDGWYVAPYTSSDGEQMDAMR